MEKGSDLKRILQAAFDHQLSPDEAMAEICADSTLSVGSIACLDISRKTRCGVPEVILAEGKEPAHLCSIVKSYVQSADRCLGRPDQHALVYHSGPCHDRRTHEPDRPGTQLRHTDDPAVYDTTRSYDIR